MFTNKVEFFATGCIWEVEYGGLKDLKLENTIKKIVNTFESRYSRFKVDSFLNKISTGGEFKITKQDYNIFKYYQIFYEVTQGKFSPLIGTNLIRIGYDNSYSLIPKNMVKLPDIHCIYTFTKNKIMVKKGYNFDFGGIGKGYLIDKIFKILKKHMIKTFLINGSGDIKFYDYLNRSIYIGLNDPTLPGSYVGYTSLQSGYSICGSATDKRRWGKFVHIVNAKNNTFPNKILASFVISKSAIIADFLATSLFFDAPSLLKTKFKFEYLLVKKGSKVKSKKFILNVP